MQCIGQQRRADGGQPRQQGRGILQRLDGRFPNFDDIALAIAEGILDTLQIQGENNSQISSYTVQAGAFRNAAYADRLQQELLDQDFPAVISQDGGLYRVTVGTYPALDEAAAMERRLKRAGYQTVIVRS